MVTETRGSGGSIVFGIKRRKFVIATKVIVNVKYTETVHIIIICRAESSCLVRSRWIDYFFFAVTITSLQKVVRNIGVTPSKERKKDVDDILDWIRTKKGRIRRIPLVYSRRFISCFQRSHG